MQQNIFENMRKKCTGGKRFIYSKENINHLLNMDDIKISTKNKKNGTRNPFMNYKNQDIGMEFGIEKFAMLIIIIISVLASCS